jgi:hypothetical protein
VLPVLSHPASVQVPVNPIVNFTRPTGTCLKEGYFQFFCTLYKELVAKNIIKYFISILNSFYYLFLLYSGF